jgi:hypothetical protein
MKKIVCENYIDVIGMKFPKLIQAVTSDVDLFASYYEQKNKKLIRKHYAEFKDSLNILSNLLEQSAGKRVSGIKVYKLALEHLNPTKKRGRPRRAKVS